MNTEPVHRIVGTTLSDWIARIPNELAVDAVGLWQIIPALRHEFGLEGDALEVSARAVIADLLAHGVRAVVNRSPQEGYWKELTHYGETDAAIVDGVIAEWHEMRRDPDVGDLWFALPEMYIK